jgi:hypothetical protein
MPFPTSGAAPATAPAPSFQPPAAAPGMPSAPPMAPPVIQAPALPDLWVPVNGQPAQLKPDQWLTMPPQTPAHRVDGIGGWQTIAKFLPAAAAAPSAPLDRAAFQAPPQAGQLPQQAATGGPDASLFAGMESAQISRRGSFITEGDYILRLSSSEWKLLRKSGKYSGVFEFVVAVSSYNAADPRTHKALTEGTGTTVFIQKNDSFNGNMKEMILALSGFDKAGQPRPETDVVTPAEVAATFGPGQPFAGAEIYCEARDRKTKEDKDFTNMNYWPIPKTADGKYDMERFHREIR